MFVEKMNCIFTNVCSVCYRKHLRDIVSITIQKQNQMLPVGAEFQFNVLLCFLVEEKCFRNLIVIKLYGESIIGIKINSLHFTYAKKYCYWTRTLSKGSPGVKLGGLGSSQKGASMSITTVFSTMSSERDLKNQIYNFLVDDSFEFIAVYLSPKLTL